MAKAKSPYGEFAFDREVIRKYWYLLVALILLALSIPTMGLGLILLAVWLLSFGNWWISLIYRRLFYEVDEDSLNIRKGVIFHVEKVIPLEKITDMKLMQGPVARHYGVYTVFVQTAGMGTQFPEATMSFESHEKAVEVRERVMLARKKLLKNPRARRKADD